jgi:undecaprenyl-diphosphatase
MRATRELDPGPGDVDAAVRARLGHRSPGVRVAVVSVAAYLLTTTAALALGWLVARTGPAGPAGLDATVTTWFARHRVDALDGVGTHLSTPTAPLAVVGLTTGAVLVLLLRRRWREATVLLVAVPLELAAYLSTVTLVDRPRPDVVPLEPAPVTASFPSGHAAAAVALYGALAVVARASATSGRAARWVVVVAAVVVVGVGVGRVYAGLHHPSDVAAGWAVGAAALVAAVLAARMVPEEPPGPG